MQEARKARRALDQRWLALSTFALGIKTRSPLTPAVRMRTKSAMLDRSPVFGHNRNLSIGRGLAPLPNPQ